MANIEDNITRISRHYMLKTCFIRVIHKDQKIAAKHALEATLSRQWKFSIQLPNSSREEGWAGVLQAHWNIPQANLAKGLLKNKWSMLLSEAQNMHSYYNHFHLKIKYANRDGPQVCDSIRFYFFYLNNDLKLRLLPTFLAWLVFMILSPKGKNMNCFTKLLLFILKILMYIYAMRWSVWRIYFRNCL